MFEVEVIAEEQELIEILREMGEDGSRLVIEHQDGAWDVALTAPLVTRYGDDKTPSLRTIRGTGTSFASAWNAMRRTDEG